MRADDVETKRKRKIVEERGEGAFPRQSKWDGDKRSVSKIVLMSTRPSKVKFSSKARTSFNAPSLVFVKALSALRSDEGV